jgi:hypothetical protein
MMSELTQRRQFRIDDERQLFRADQLEPGMSVALVRSIEGATTGERLARTVLACAGLVDKKEGESRRSAARRAWDFKVPSGLLPEWKGIVESPSRGNAVGDRFAGIIVTGEPGDARHSFSFINTEPADLPDVPERDRCLHILSLSSLGLEPIQPNRFGGYTSLYQPGHWHPVAMLALDQ